MERFEQYLNYSYRLEIIPDEDEGGFVGMYPDLPGCITSGNTIEEVAANAQDAKKTWLKAALEDGEDIPIPNSSQKYSGQFKLRLPKSLHRSLAEHARKEGISMNQYCNYLLAMNDQCYATERG